jgi:adenosylhomocysteine nucleosidase
MQPETGPFEPQVVVLISADAEWRALLEMDPALAVEPTPFGEYALRQMPSGEQRLGVVFFHDGWGKIAAAASTQYAIDRWRPALLANLGTCGGIRGGVGRGEIILAERTLVYDIYEQMGDADAHLAQYAIQIDLSWLSGDLPLPVRRALHVSADRDLLPHDLPELSRRYGAVAADWESGAIAWVAQRNQVRCLILRGVTDLVGEGGGEAYGNIEFFQQAALEVMRRLLDSLPGWLRAAGL